MKILLPVDGSDYTKRMLAYIAANDELLGAGHEYVAVTVVPAIPAHAARFLSPEVVQGHYQDEAERVLAPVKKFAAQQGWSLRTLHLAGHAAECLAELARAEKAQLIVMGSHGHSSLGSMVMGSVASGVMARCQVPVLLVR